MNILNKAANIVRDPAIISRKFHQNRKISNNPDAAKGTHSSRRLNLLLAGKEGQYLEIGVAHGYTIEAVNFQEKVGVDPFPKCKWKHVANISVNKMESDEYFQLLETNKEYVGIFLDGAHTFEQSYRDVINSLNHLSADGFILFDDTVPEDEFSALDDIALCHQKRKEAGSSRETWSGDVFKTILVLAAYHPEVEINTIITPQHPQTIITWREGKKCNMVAISSSEFAKFKSISYQEIFNDFSKVDKIFNFGFELGIIERVLKL